MLKRLIFFFILTFSLTGYTANEWKKIAYSLKGCGEKFEIYAKEGETYLKLKSSHKEVMLKSINHDNFSDQSPHQVRFSSKNFDYEYIHPSVIDGNPPLLLSKNIQMGRCKLISVSN